MTDKILNETFTVEIDLNTGEATIDVIGSDGTSCQEATTSLEQALGGQVIRKLKSEALSVLKKTKKALNKLSF